MPVKWMTTQKSLRLLKKAKYGRLATSDENQQPYITPLNPTLPLSIKNPPKTGYFSV
nr:hypothetical protein [candidate division KSB1 bacterium]